MINNTMFDLYIDEGVDFSLYIVLEDIFTDAFGNETVTPVNLSNISNVSAQIRKDFSEVGAPLITFDAAVTNPLGGEIGLGLSVSDTTGLVVNSNLPVVHLGYYDVILTNSSGTKSKVVGGKVWVNQTVTR